MKIKSAVIILSLMLLTVTGFAQQVVLNRILEWKKPQQVAIDKEKFINCMHFTGAKVEKRNNSFLPVFIEKVPIADGMFKVMLKVKEEEQISVWPGLEKNDVLEDYEIIQQLIYVNKKSYALVKIIPLSRNWAVLKRLISFELTVSSSVLSNAKSKKQAASWATNSVLSSGVWYKIAVPSSGIFSINKAFLTNMGINVSSIDPRNIKIYGRGGAMMQQHNSAPADDDLVENAIVVQGENDGRFDDADRILFYAQGPDSWGLDTATNRFLHTKNVYSNFGYYFLNVGTTQGKRVQQQASLSGIPLQTVSAYDERFFHEEDKKNFLKSGREWWGEEFDKETSYTFNLTFPGLVATEQVHLRSQAVGRSFGGSTMAVSVNGNTLFNEYFFPVLDDYTDTYVNAPVIKEISFSVNGSAINLDYTYSKPTLNSIAWLNFFELNFRRSLQFNSPQTAFRDTRSVGSVNTLFNINSASTINVWDITSPSDIKQLVVTRTGSITSFQANTTKLREYISFDGSSFPVPSAGVKINNQNLHASAQIDMVILAYSGFLTEANRLADFHRTKSGLSVLVTTPEEVYNEFSSGTPDVCAVRNMMRMFYERSTSASDEPKYLLMFGDASYDYRNIKGQNANLVLTYESRNSVNPIVSYCSDDFFGFLDANEGEWLEQGGAEEGLDLGIGRFPVKNNTEAATVVNKIISYHSAAAMKDWRNALAFVGDDEDYDIHIDQSDVLANLVDTTNRTYNVNKIFLDAYKQQSTPAGSRYPDVQTAINNQVNRGCLLMNYTGHGGETGWAHERILTIDDINSWTNKNALPLFVTATCEFSKYDDPERTSAGELVLLNPNGGGVGLFTTVRLVFAFPNFVLNMDILKNNMFSPRSNGDMPTLGDIFTQSKNTSPSYNSRNFSFLGDPAMKLAYPKHKVVTTAINGKPVSALPDTLKALSKVSISGVVQDKNSNTLTSFNGTVYVTIFDKTESIRTLANDIFSSSRTFNLRKNVIYRGRASVVNGSFSFNFIVPKDISYINGFGKISYYAENGNEDAAGYFTNFMIGGTADSVVADNKGPAIKLFMNDYKFVSGGSTNQNPLFIASLSDDNGINTVGNGIGREITLIVDGNTASSLIMNDYYQSKLNSYTEGEVRYDFRSLAPGKHTLILKAWDVFNNSSEATLDFIVADNAGLALNNILNYPNPFTSFTTFHFDHNKSGQPMKIQVQIFTVTGKLIKTLATEVASAESHFDKLTWDGKDEYGDYIGKGVYIYKVTARTAGGDRDEKLEKLVILK